MAPLIAKSALNDFLKLSLPFVGVRADTQTANYEDVYKGIRSTLVWPKNGLHFEAIHRLWNILEIAVHMGDATADQWQLLGIIRDAWQTEEMLAPLSEQGVWTEALTHAGRLLNQGRHSSGISTKTRQSVVAESLRFLRSNGFPIEIDGYGARLTSKSYRKICTKIEKHIAFAGGANYANVLLDGMSATGRVINGSLISARRPVQVYQQAQAGTPFHFLYNLSLKHLRTAGRSSLKRQNLLKAEMYARHLVAALDVEPHSIYENMSMPSRFLEKVLRETVVYDELFSFPQWQPQAANHLIEWWIQALAKAGCSFPHATASEWAEFGKGLHALSHVSRLVKFTTLQNAATGHLMEVISIPANRMNWAYKTPMDTAERADSQFPLIKIERDEFLVQPRAVVTRAFVERLSELMRQQIRRESKTPEKALAQLDTQFGRALEILTVTVLKNLGVKVTIEGGKYRGRNRRERLEIDIAVETEDRIFLIECKKKALTAISRGGDTLALLGDLNDSFLKMQAQLARHEAKLRGEGKISFLDGGILELRGRHVEKLAISLFDHGALQDRALIIPLFERLIGSTVSTVDHAAQETISSMNKQMSILSESMKIICDTQRDMPQEHAVHGFAMSTWWLSVDQLQYLCGSGKGLWQGLRKLRHLTTRSGDIIWEAHCVENLNSVSRALLDVTQKMDSLAFI